MMEAGSILHDVVVLLFYNLNDGHNTKEPPDVLQRVIIRNLQTSIDNYLRYIMSKGLDDKV
jgi:hypothetical protein